MKEFEGLKYCTKCTMLETAEGAKFNKKGECIACQAQETKKKVNWEKKKIELGKILNEAKQKAGDNYDCIVPISGGKDSIYQLHVICKEYNMKPLAVTFNHGGYTETGLHNLWLCLKEFDIDHFQFTLNDKVIKKIQKRSIETIGDYCWHCHAMCNSITLQIAAMYGINLIVWGESGAEYGHQGQTYDNIVKFDENYFMKLSTKVQPEDFAKDDLTMRDLFPAQIPNTESLKGVRGIHLGNFIPWNADKQVEEMKKLYGWREREVGGSYKNCKSIECCFEPIHEFTCYLKRGFARSSLQTSQDIRDGKMTREEAWELINKYERIEPADLNYFLNRAGITAVEFRDMIEKLKHEKIKDLKLPAGKEWRTIEEDGIPFIDLFLETMKFHL